jgi:drug/metabolite transporter (DMT)-like permease
MSWYALAVVTLTCFSFQSFLYKVSAARECNTAWTTFSFMTTVAFLSAILFIVQGEGTGGIGFLVTISLINSASYFLATVTHIEALKHIPGTIGFPLARLNLVPVVLMSVFLFGERLTLRHGVGIVLALAATFFLAGRGSADGGVSGRAGYGLMLIAVCIALTAVAALSSKVAALETNIPAFQALVYTLGALFSLAARNRLASGAVAKTREAIWLGIVIGIINFIGYTAFLRSLTTGPLSLVAPIVGMSFVISVLLSMMVYRERLRLRGFIGAALTALTVILLRP